MFTWASKRSCFITPFGNQRVNGFETLLKLHGTNIFLFFHEFDINLLEKCLPLSHLKSSEYPSLIITEIIAFERDVYLSV